jgi:transposase
MSYRPYAPPAPLLIGYDPFRDLPGDHLARLVEQVVEASVRPGRRPAGAGQPPFDPRLPIKVLVYGYATGQRSSRQLERLCDESLPYLFLTRGDTPSYRTLCTVRVEQSDLIEQVWVDLFAVADAVGLQRLGHIVVDSTKLRANASPEAVLTADEYEPVRRELAQILAEAAAVDAQEAAEGRPGVTRVGREVPPEQMREILRRVRKRCTLAKRAVKEATVGQQSEPSAAVEAATPAAAAAGEPLPPGAAGTGRPKLCPRMRPRVEAAQAAIEAAQAAGEKHLCLTDPAARMMPEGREKRVRECHSFEVAVDREAGLLVVGQTTQEGPDNARLEALVAAAQAHEPTGVKAADGDSGYYGGDAVGRLLAAGIDLCVPDSHTACDLHRGQPIGTTRERARGQVPFEYDPEADCYRCPEGNELRRRQQRRAHGQTVTDYRAVRDCRACPLAAICLTQAKAKRRTLRVGEEQPALAAALQRFAEPAHQERYRHRGEVVESVFGFVRGVLGYTRFLLRGKERVASEGRLIKVGYQLRKVHGTWATQRAG